MVSTKSLSLTTGDQPGENVGFWTKLSFVAGQILMGTAHVIVVHSTKGNISEGTQSEQTEEQTGYKYSTPLAVLLSEMLKLSFCVVMYYWGASASNQAWKTAKDEIENGRGNSACATQFVT